MEKEFYTCDDRVYILADGKSVEFTEKDTELTDEILTKVENFYPEAHKALTECYSKSSLNQPYYRISWLADLSNAILAVSTRQRMTLTKMEFSTSRKWLVR